MKILRLAVDRGGVAAVAWSGRSGPDHAAHRACRGSRHSRSDAGAHLCRPHRVRRVLRQAVRHRRKAQHRAAARAVARDLRRRQGGDDQAAARRQIPRRRAVRRRGREILARAAPDHAGLVPQAGAGRARPCRRRRSPDHQAGAEDALLAADRPAHRSRRHDGLAEGREGGRRQVRPASGLRRPLQIRRTRAAGPHRVREIRRLLEQGQRLHRPHRVPADRRCHGAARQPEIRRPRSDRARCWRPTSRTCAPTRSSSCRPRSSSAIRASPSTSATTRPRAPLSQSAKVRQALDLSIDREAINQVVFNGEFTPGNQWVSPEHPYYQKAFPVRPRDRRQGQGAAEGSRRHAAGQRRLHGAEGRRERSGRAGDPVDGGGSRLRHEDPGHRIRDLAEAGRGRRIPGLPARLERPHRSRRQFLHLPARPRRRRTTAPSPIPTPTRRSTTPASSPIRRSARRSTRS